MGSIRLFLAFTVFVSHAVALGIDVMPAPVAVQAFFIISGFYMSLILNEKYETAGLFVFYTNRLLRLFPTYLFVLLLSFAFLYSFDVGIFTRFEKFQKVVTSGPLMTLSYLWTNIAIFGQDLLFLLGIDPSDHSFYWDLNAAAPLKAWSLILVPQAWSLSMEFYFYLCAPFILRRRACWVSVLFVGSLALRVFIVSQGAKYDLFLRRFFPAELCLFLSGYFSYILLKYVRKCNRKYLTGLFSAVTLLLVLFMYNRINSKYALALLTVTLVVTMPFIFNFLKDNRIDRFLGNISFPIYMAHFLIIEFVDDYVDEYSIWTLLPPVLFVALSIYYGIERPIDRWRQARVKPVCVLNERPWCSRPTSALQAKASSLVQ
jgi:peptidoglycan/LPS O-acetylase OafA/YrhL